MFRRSLARSLSAIGGRRTSVTIFHRALCTFKPLTEEWAKAGLGAYRADATSESLNRLLFVHFDVID